MAPESPTWAKKGPCIEMADFPWLSDHVERLKYWHQRGYSGHQITVELNSEFGAHLGRNAVIGKLHRLGITDFHRAKQNGRNRGVTKGMKRTLTPRKVIARAPSQTGEREVYREIVLYEPEFVPLEGLVCEPVSMLDREEHQCCWPLPGGMYCGLRRAAKYELRGRAIRPTYCPAHHHASITPGKYKTGIWRTP